MAANRKEIVQRINEGFAENNLEKVLTYCTDDFTWTMVGDSTVRGKDPIRKWMASMVLSRRSSRLSRLLPKVIPSSRAET